MPFSPATIAFGSIVGFSLGLTGSGGSILAIPLLVYGVGLPVEQALPVSLLMVAAIAVSGAARQTWSRQVDWRAALLFSLTGMLVSPVVVGLTHNVDDKIRLGLFALLMLVVAGRMAFGRGQTGKVKASRHHSMWVEMIRITLGGALAGALAGFFGVGGGFVIVPLLTLIFAMPYKRAVGTSLASIALISSSALLGYFMQGATIDGELLSMFIGGGILGLLLGTRVVNSVPEVIARRVFATVTALLAIFMIFDKFILHQGGV